MTVLVTDHHAVPFEEHEGRRTEKKSLADAVVNPHQQDCGYPYKELCGAGVAWNVIRVLYENYDMDKLINIVESYNKAAGFCCYGNCL